MESTHGKLQFTAPLTAITAAVVGVVASLALFFMGHIAFKTVEAGFVLAKVDWPAWGCDC